MTDCPNIDISDSRRVTFNRRSSSNHVFSSSYHAPGVPRLIHAHRLASLNSLHLKYAVPEEEVHALLHQKRRKKLL